MKVAEQESRQNGQMKSEYCEDVERRPGYEGRSVITHIYIDVIILYADAKMNSQQKQLINSYFIGD